MLALVSGKRNGTVRRSPSQRRQSGLVSSYYRARYYDQNAGRFYSEDPIDFAGGVNFYQYAMNQPIDNSDPFWAEVHHKDHVGHGVL